MTKYKDTYPDDLIKMMAKGMLDCEIYAEWDISKKTFYKWRNEIPAMEEAFDIGYPKCEAFYVRHARQCMLDGDDKGFKFFIGLMNNKFGWDKGAKAAEGSTTNISIGNVNMLQQKDRAGLLDYIQTLTTKHQDVIDGEFENRSEQPLRIGTSEAS